MTWQKWTTTEQEDWLKGQIAAFIETQVNKTTASAFFPETLKDWRKAWPTPEPTPEEAATLKIPGEVTKKKRAKDNEVSQLVRCTHDRRDSPHA